MLLLYPSLGTISIISSVCTPLFIAFGLPITITHKKSVKIWNITLTHISIL